MNNLATPRTRRWLLLALAVLTLLPLAASAQDRPDRAERLKQALDLTDAQVALVEEVVGDEAEPGDVWNVAAALTPTLTDEQKEKLFTRPECPTRNAKMHGRRGDRDQRGERLQRERLDAEARAERREAMREEMQETLGLTEAQVQQFEALHAERRAELEQLRKERQQLREEWKQRRAERPGPGELPAEVAAILTPEQQEIAKVRRALAARMMHGLHHRGMRR